MRINLFQSGFLLVNALLGLLLSNSVFAAPIQVHNTGSYHFEDNLLVFTGDHPRLYLIKNHTRNKIIIDRKIRKDPGVSAGWASTLSPGRWSALMLNRRPFMMNCTIIHKKQRYQKVYCERVLTVKTVQNFRAQNPLTIKNSYWVSENQAYGELLKSLRERGILF